MTKIHPILEEHGSFAHLKLGRQPSRRSPKNLQFAKYFEAAQLPEPPATFDLASAVPLWPMYDNDKLGDCTCAAAGHMVEAWTAANKAEVVPLNSDVDVFYWQTGSPPSNSGTAGGPTDTGRVETDVLDHWRETPLGTLHPIDGYTEVDPKNGSHVAAATWLFGGLYLGIALPITAQTQQVWDVVDPSLQGDSAPGSWGGHAVPVVAYSGTSQGIEFEVVTWGALMNMTDAFFEAYVDESYAIISPDWLANGVSPAGFNMAALQADLANL